MVTRTCYRQLSEKRRNVSANIFSIKRLWSLYEVRLILENCEQNQTANIIVSDCNEMSCSTRIFFCFSSYFFPFFFSPTWRRATITLRQLTRVAISAFVFSLYFFFVLWSRAKDKWWCLGKGRERGIKKKRRIGWNYEKNKIQRKHSAYHSGLETFVQKSYTGPRGTKYNVSVDSYLHWKRNKNYYDTIAPKFSAPY